MVCTPAFTWEKTDQSASGCVLDGKFASVGAVDNGPNQSAIKQECQADGTWKRLD